MKILSVFTYLEIETINLTHEIENKYFDPLIYFGESGSNFADERPEEEQAGEIEIATSRSLPVLNEFYQTLNKVIRLSKNVILQMNGLFDAKANSLYKDCFKKLKYNSIFDNLGNILTNLFIVDLIIQDNICLKDYWEVYNMMFAKVKTNPGTYEFTSKMVKKLQRFCEGLYNNILSGKLYQQYLDALKASIKEDMGDQVFKNKTFAEKYLEYINWKADNVQVQLQSPGIVSAPSDYMNLLTNYSIYRKLFDVQDQKLYQKLWSLQKTCPLLILYNNLQVNPGDFLARICPLKKKTKVDPPDIPAFLNSELMDKRQLFASQI